MGRSVLDRYSPYVWAISTIFWYPRTASAPDSSRDITGTADPPMRPTARGFARRFSVHAGWLVLGEIAAHHQERVHQRTSGNTDTGRTAPAGLSTVGACTRRGRHLRAVELRIGGPSGTTGWQDRRRGLGEGGPVAVGHSALQDPFGRHRGLPGGPRPDQRIAGEACLPRSTQRPGGRARPRQRTRPRGGRARHEATRCSTGGRVLRRPQSTPPGSGGDDLRTAQRERSADQA